MYDIVVSPLALYNQEQRSGDGVSFLDSDHLLLPESFSNQDRYHLVQMLLAETAELECVYPEPTTMQTVVRAWSGARLPAWERMDAALTEEYNPLHNYDRHETESGTDTGTVRDQEAEDIQDDTSSSSTGQSSNTSNTSTTTSDTLTNQVTGYNSNTFADSKKDIKAGSETGSGTQSGSDSQSVTGSTTRDRDVDRTQTRNLANSRQLHVYGNIGVTTSAQMLLGEIDVRKYDIFRIIIDEFTRYFCLMVY